MLSTNDAEELLIFCFQYSLNVRFFYVILLLLVRNVLYLQLALFWSFYCTQKHNKKTGSLNSIQK